MLHLSKGEKIHLSASHKPTNITAYIWFVVAENEKLWFLQRFVCLSHDYFLAGGSDLVDLVYFQSEVAKASSKSH